MDQSGLDQDTAQEYITAAEEEAEPEHSVELPELDPELDGEELTEAEGLRARIRALEASCCRHELCPKRQRQLLRNPKCLARPQVFFNQNELLQCLSRICSGWPRWPGILRHD